MVHGMRTAEIQTVTGTAFIVAEWRAEENAEARPLYRDPIVPLFLSAETRKAAERIAASFPPIKKVVRIRTRYFDERLGSATLGVAVRRRFCVAVRRRF